VLQMHDEATVHQNTQRAEADGAPCRQCQLLGSQQHVAICAGIYLQQVRLLPGFRMVVQSDQGARYLHVCMYICVCAGFV